MNPEIKTLSIDNYDEIIDIWLKAGLPFKPKGRDSVELMAKEMALDVCCYFGMYVDNQIIGVAIANYDGRRGWVNRLALDPDYRGKNLASQLIEKCEQFLRSVGANVICALIEDINYPSISCFQKADYICENDFKYFAKRPSKDM